MKILFTVFYDPKDLGIRYLTSHLRNIGHEVHIVALKALNDLIPANYNVKKEDITKCHLVRDGQVAHYTYNPISDKELTLLTDEIQKFSPDVIGFGTRTRNFVYLDRIIPALRSGMPSAFIVAGGAGPTCEPHIPLRLGVDAVIRGEGEYPLSDLISALSKGEDWRTIDNISYIDNSNNIINNPLRMVEKNIDKFIFPSLELEKDVLINNDKIAYLLDESNYGSDSFSSNFRYSILGSRGCMGDCSYCGGRYLHSEYAKEGLNMPRVRHRSLENILEELIVAKNKFPITMVQFWDEFFVWPINKLLNFFKDYKKYINIPFWAYLSPDQLYKSSELLESAIDAGLTLFSVGLQTADEQFCREIYNRNNCNEHILYVSNRMYNMNIPVQLLMILGNPIQNKESLKKNWEFLSKLKFDPSFVSRVWISFTKLYAPPYPSKLFINHPEILSNPISNEEFYYDSMLCCLRLIMNDDEFFDIVNSKHYSDSPWLLGSVYYKTLENKHMKYLMPEINRLGGQKVYFWGCGYAYQKRKHLFQLVDPICMLHDFPWEKRSIIDNMKIYTPENIELDTEKPVVIFARHEHVNSIYRKVKYKYGFSDIVVAAYISDEEEE